MNSNTLFRLHTISLIIILCIVVYMYLISREVRFLAAKVHGLEQEIMEQQASNLVGNLDNFNNFDKLDNHKFNKFNDNTRNINNDIIKGLSTFQDAKDLVHDLKTTSPHKTSVVINSLKGGGARDPSWVCSIANVDTPICIVRTSSPPKQPSTLVEIEDDTVDVVDKVHQLGGTGTDIKNVVKMIVHEISNTKADSGNYDDGDEGCDDDGGDDISLDLQHMILRIEAEDDDDDNPVTNSNMHTDSNMYTDNIAQSVHQDTLVEVPSSEKEPDTPDRIDADNRSETLQTDDTSILIDSLIDSDKRQERSSLNSEVQLDQIDSDNRQEREAIFSNMKMDQLRKLLRSKQIDSNGKKEVLIQRLLNLEM